MLNRHIARPLAFSVCAVLLVVLATTALYIGEASTGRRVQKFMLQRR